MRALLVAALCSLVAGCGDGVDLDRSQPASELSDSERLELCRRAYDLFADPDLVDDRCEYAGVDDMTDPEMCREDAMTCREVAGPIDPDRVCAMEEVVVELACPATVGTYLDCIDAFQAAHRSFFASFSCDDAGPEPVPDPPAMADVPGCAALLSECPSVMLYY